MLPNGTGPLFPLPSGYYLKGSETVSEQTASASEGFQAEHKLIDFQQQNSHIQRTDSVAQGRPHALKPTLTGRFNFHSFRYKTLSLGTLYIRPVQTESKQIISLNIP